MTLCCRDAEKDSVRICEKFAVCYTEADFIECLNTYVFPDCKSRMLQNLEQTGASLPVEHRKCPPFNFSKSKHSFLDGLIHYSAIHGYNSIYSFPLLL